MVLLFIATLTLLAAVDIVEDTVRRLPSEHSDCDGLVAFGSCWEEKHFSLKTTVDKSSVNVSINKCQFKF